MPRVPLPAFRAAPRFHPRLACCGFAAALFSSLSGAEAPSARTVPDSTALRAPTAAAPSDLHRAVRLGDADTRRRLLESGADVKARDALGNTPLHLAALRGDAEAVDALLAKGADPGATNHADASPLHYGVGSERVVAALLARGAAPDPLSKAGVTPLLGAVARADSFHVVRRLIAAGANVNHRRLNVRGPYGGASVLTIAISAGDRRTIDLLIEKGARVDVQQGTSPLAAAAYGGDLETVKLLVERGADLDYRSGFAGTALNFALFAGHQHVARYLLERGANPSLPSTMGHGTPAMVFSAYHDEGDPGFARLLLSRGVDVNAANDAGETALSYALRNGPDTPLVQFLREAGGRTPPAAARTKTIPAQAVPKDPAARAAMIRDGAQRALDLLQRNSTAFLENGFVRDRARCVSCHQQALPAVAFGWARERGFKLDEAALGRLLHATVSQRDPQAENARQLDEPTPSADVTLGFDADGLHALRFAPDDLSDAMSHYLLAIQHPDGSWASHVRRPPMEDGPIIGTAWSARAVQLYPPAGREAEVAAALQRARTWLGRQTPRTHNERVFHLLGLAWADERPERLRPLADRLIETQRADGGWAQLPGLSSDAWATGSAMIALHKAGVAPTAASYQRAVDFLLHTQFADGSWWVRSRSWPFQPHFDGQFPHGKDQWISAAGTAFAAMGLLLTIEPTVRPENLPDARALIAHFMSRDPRPAVAAAPRVATSRASVSFSRDIKPLIERSCAGCHVGEKVKGGFSLGSRDAVLKGGQSGDPAIVPGLSGESRLLRYISDQIEDLEMPPLARREKYPPLNATEIALVRHWIDGGATWDDVP